MIPLVNLASQYERFKPELLQCIEEVVASTQFIHGKKVSEFEKAFATLHPGQTAIGCSNGTSALFLPLFAWGIGAGDEVITVPNSFIATAEAICHVGAKPVFVDVDPDTYTMDPKLLEAAITPRTKAIIPVHLYGVPCDMEPILKIAEKHGLKILEDCAQAHLARYRDQVVGTFGHAAAYSFYPGKNLGAFGDAGLVLVKDSADDALIRKLLNHGRLGGKYSHDIVGYNHRMDEIQAAVLNVKLRHLNEWNKVRQANALVYNSRLEKEGIKAITQRADSKVVYHQYVIQVSNREVVMDQLKRVGISTAIHYPTPLHEQEALAFLGYQHGDFPVTESLSQRILSLPMCPELTETQVHLICDELLKVAEI